MSHAIAFCSVLYLVAAALLFDAVIFHAKRDVRRTW